MGKNNRALQRHRDSKNAGIYYTKKFRWINTCVYCGQPKDCFDHVFPLSRAAQINLQNAGARKQIKFGLYIVPCCNSCNLIAGNAPFCKIIDKRNYIQKKLYKKYKKKLRTVMWDEDEINELGKNLRAEVLKMLNNRYVLEKRVYYPKSPTSFSPDIVKLFLSIK